MKFLFTILFVNLFILVNAQLNSNLKPLSDYKNDFNLEFIKLPTQNWEKEKSLLEKRNQAGHKVYEFGYSFEVNYTLEDGQWTKLNNGDKIWRIAFSSPGAKSMNIVWSEFYIPKGGALYVYNKDRTEIYGAYTHLQNNPSNQLLSWLISGDEIVIEYNQPKGIKGRPRLIVSEVIHGLFSTGRMFKDLNNSGDCQYDIGCNLGDDIEAMKNHLSRSVALMLVGGTSFCTASLINNERENLEPFILTADHCIVGVDPAQVAVRFGYISPTADCATTEPSMDGPTNMILTGSELLARNPLSDFALLRMNNNVPQEWNRVYAGWDRRGISPEFSYTIHHPSGDVMKVSRENDALAKQSDSNLESWEITEANGGWELGTTEPGSSGSPIYSDAGLIIGQLCCGFSACSGTLPNGLNDNYGRMDASWDFGDSEANRLVDWLSPSQNLEFINSFPRLELIAFDASVQLRINAIGGDNCNANDSLRIEASIQNVGSDTLYNYGLIFEGFNQRDTIVVDSHPLASLETLTFLDSTISIGLDEYTYKAILWLPDSLDQNPSNDTSESTYTNQAPNIPLFNLTNLKLELMLDEYPSETSWTLTNQTTGQVYSGDNYFEELSLVEEELFLSEGCWQFVISDAESDGICCGFGEGYLRLTDDFDNVIFEASDFGRQATFDFQVGNFNFDLGTFVEITPLEFPAMCDLEQDLSVRIGVRNFSDSLATDYGLIIEQPNGIDTFYSNQPLAKQDEYLFLDTVIRYEGENITYKARLYKATDNNSSNNQDEALYEATNATIVNTDFVVVVLQYDEYPDETTWSISHQSQPITIESVRVFQENYFLTDTVELIDGCWQFQINDGSGDGICCDFGQGYVQLLDDQGELLFEASNFGTREDFYFVINTYDSIQANPQINIVQTPIDEGLCGEFDSVYCEVQLLNNGAQSISNAAVQFNLNKQEVVALQHIDTIQASEVVILFDTVLSASGMSMSAEVQAVSVDGDTLIDATNTMVLQNTVEKILPQYLTLTLSTNNAQSGIEWLQVSSVNVIFDSDFDENLILDEGEVDINNVERFEIDFTVPNCYTLAWGTGLEIDSNIHAVVQLQNGDTLYNQNYVDFLDYIEFSVIEEDFEKDVRLNADVQQIETFCSELQHFELILHAENIGVENIPPSAVELKVNQIVVDTFYTDTIKADAMEVILDSIFSTFSSEVIIEANILDQDIDENILNNRFFEQVELTVNNIDTTNNETILVNYEIVGDLEETSYRILDQDSNVVFEKELTDSTFGNFIDSITLENFNCYSFVFETAEIDGGLLGYSVRNYEGNLLFSNSRFIVDERYIYVENLVNAISQENDPSLMIYPNPTMGRLFVDAKLPINHSLVIDQWGRPQMEIIGNQPFLDLSKLNAGLYFIQFTFENGDQQVKKVILY